MRQQAVTCLFFVSLVLASCAPASDAPKAEEAGKEPAKTQEERIVATTVSATELADVLNLELVGIPTSYKSLPERYEGVAEIGNPMSLIWRWYGVCRLMSPGASLLWK